MDRRFIAPQQRSPLWQHTPLWQHIQHPTHTALLNPANMQLAAAFILAVTSAVATLACPILNARDAAPPNIGFGQQLQNTDQANHWVTW